MVFLEVVSEKPRSLSEIYLEQYVDQTWVARRKSSIFALEEYFVCSTVGDFPQFWHDEMFNILLGGVDGGFVMRYACRVMWQAPHAWTVLLTSSVRKKARHMTHGRKPVRLVNPDLSRGPRVIRGGEALLRNSIHHACNTQTTQQRGDEQLH